MKIVDFDPEAGLAAEARYLARFERATELAEAEVEATFRTAKTLFSEFEVASERLAAAISAGLAEYGLWISDTDVETALFAVSDLRRYFDEICTDLIVRRAGEIVGDA